MHSSKRIQQFPVVGNVSDRIKIVIIAVLMAIFLLNYIFSSKTRQGQKDKWILHNHECYLIDNSLNLIDKKNLI